MLSQFRLVTELTVVETILTFTRSLPLHLDLRVSDRVTTILTPVLSNRLLLPQLFLTPFLLSTTLLRTHLHRLNSRTVDGLLRTLLLTPRAMELRLYLKLVSSSTDFNITERRTPSLRPTTYLLTSYLSTSTIPQRLLRNQETTTNLAL